MKLFVGESIQRTEVSVCENARARVYVFFVSIRTPAALVWSAIIDTHRQRHN